MLKTLQDIIDRSKAMKRPYDPQGLRRLAEDTPDEHAAEALYWAADLITPPQPDWDRVPAEAEAFAISPAGMGLFFRTPPALNGTERDWEVAGRVAADPGYLRLAYDWKDTLSVRPSEERRLADKFGLTVEQVREIRGSDGDLQEV